MRASNVSVIDDWEASVDHLIETLKHLKEMRGKPGEAAARLDLEKAQMAYAEASEKLG